MGVEEFASIILGEFGWVNALLVFIILILVVSVVFIFRKLKKQSEVMNEILYLIDEETYYRIIGD